MREALKLALDLATMHYTDNGYAELRSKVRELAKEALAQPDPVGINGLTEAETNATASVRGLVNTTPPQRKPLTYERIDELWKLWLTTKHGAVTKTEGRIFARAIEAAHGIKE